MTLVDIDWFKETKEQVKALQRELMSSETDETDGDNLSTVPKRRKAHDRWFGSPPH